MYDTSRQIEHMRVAMGNRVGAIERGDDVVIEEMPPVYARLLQQLVDMEGLLDDALTEELRKIPVYREWLQHVKGIGPALSSQVLALLLPPLANRGPSTWYKAAGLVPEQREDGTFRLPRPRKGEGAITYHAWLRRCLHNVGESFVRSGGFYRHIYDQKKLRLFHQHQWVAAAILTPWESTGTNARVSWLEHRFGQTIEEISGKENHADAIEWGMRPSYASAVKLAGGPSDPDWPLGRIESVARWITVKLFLAHLWEVWCDIEGIDRRDPYIVQYGTDEDRHHFIPAPRWDGVPKSKI